IPAIVGCWGVDVRAAGGLIVGAGAVIDGKTYAFENPQAVPCALPQHVADRLDIAPHRPIAETRIVGDLDEPASIERAKAFLAEAPGAVEGAGGDTLTYQTTARLFDFGISPETALELLDERWNHKCAPAWDYEDLARKVRNVCTY